MSEEMGGGDGRGWVLELIDASLRGFSICASEPINTIYARIYFNIDEKHYSHIDIADIGTLLLFVFIFLLR